MRRVDDLIFSVSLLEQVFSGLDLSSSAHFKLGDEVPSIELHSVTR